MQSQFHKFALLIALCVCFLLTATSANAQTGSFTYQGKLTDGGVSANGTYQIQFALFDSPANGNQVGSTITKSSVQAAGGIFTVDLDFGVNSFDGSARFLQISVFSVSSNSYVTLVPRQQISSVPYAVKALNSVTADNTLNLGGVPAANYVTNGDDRLSDSRDPNPGSGFYVQNGNTQQASANFNIDGTGKASVLDAGTQFNLGGQRLITNPGGINLYVGVGTGQSAGGSNAYFGTLAGSQTASGSNNTFIGGEAGEQSNNTSANTFIGSLAGYFNTSGAGNTMLGSQANPTVGNLNFATAIGFGSTVSTSNTIVLGRSLGQETVLIPGALNVNNAITGLNNLNITGNGTFSANLSASLVNATTQFNLNNSRILTATGTNNLFAGIGAGQSNTGAGNSFFGRNAGQLNTNGGQNSFFGADAGLNNNGTANVFVGSAAGKANTSGFANVFVGADAGIANLSGNGSSFYGYQSGYTNTLGNWNSFFGAQSGFSNLSGSNNSFFGTYAGRSNVSGNSNAFFGLDTGRNNSQGNYNSFFGSLAGRENIDGDGNSYFGVEAGRLGSSGNNNSFFGFDAGLNNLSGSSNTFVGVSSGTNQSTGTQNTLLGAFSNVGQANLSFATAIGAGAVVGTSNTIVLGRANGSDRVRLPGLGSAGSSNLCRNVNDEISVCSSSLRYKKNVNTFTTGLDIVNRLRPITFDWKQGGMHDLGLGAEEVADVNELLVIRNADGQVEGVKYDRVGVVLINAVKEQQAQIEELKKQIEELKETVLRMGAKEREQ